MTCNRNQVIGVEGTVGTILAGVFCILARGRWVRNVRTQTFGVVLKRDGWKVVNQAWTWSPPGFLVHAAEAAQIEYEELRDLLTMSRFAGKPGQCGRAYIMDDEDGGLRLTDLATGADLGPVIIRE